MIHEDLLSTIKIHRYLFWVKAESKIYMFELIRKNFKTVNSSLPFKEE